MGKAAHYFNGSIWQQFGVTEADITLGTSIIADYFISIKDGQDNIYVWCGKLGSPYGTRANIIKITKAGIKTVGYIPSGSGALNINAMPSFILDRSQQKIWLAFTSSYGSSQYILYSLPVVFNNLENVALTQYKNNLGYANMKFAIYQDRYIWVASGNTVRIYDYDTKVELASKLVTNTGTVINIACSVGNLCYTIGTNEGSPAGSTLSRLTFNGVNSISQTALASSINFYTSAKQLLIDKWGDLIILTNSGTASTLLKYTTTGVLVDTKNLANPSYNLAIDADGNYFFYTALKEYQINANTAQGQPFTSLGYETRGTGNTGFGSNSTGYQPSVYA